MRNFNISAPNMYSAPVNGIKLFKQKPLVLQDKPTRRRGIADQVNLTPEGRTRLE